MFELTEEQNMIKATAKEFADKELAPKAAEVDKKKIFPRQAMKKMAEMGFLGMLIPEKYGGTQLGNFCLVLTLEEINRVCASTGITLSVHNSLATSPIVRHGNEALKQKYLPRLASGELLGAYGLTEPNAGSDASAIETTSKAALIEELLEETKATLVHKIGLTVTIYKGRLS